jgi:hypothetical protein
MIPTPEFKVLLYGPGLPPAGIKFSRRATAGGLTTACRESVQRDHGDVERLSRGNDNPTLHNLRRLETIDEVGNLKGAM